MKCKLIQSLILFFICAKITCAGSPLWTFNPLTATTLTVTNTSTATVQYTITNQSTKTHTLTIVPITGVTQDTSAGCGNPFTLTGHQSCVLSLIVQANQINGSLQGGPIVCQANPNGTPNQNSCYQPNSNNRLNISVIPQFLYVSDGNAKLWQCALNNTGGFSNACIPSSMDFLATISSTFATFSGTTYLYVSDATSNLWKCTINTTTGIIGTCTALTNSTSPGFSDTNGAAFAQFSGVTYGYIVDFSQSYLWKCPMNATGDFSGGCTKLTDAFDFAIDVTIQTFSGTTYAYVSDLSQNLWKCPINPATGNFSGACMALTNSPTSFSQTSSVTFDESGGNVYAYVSDVSDTLWQCPMNIATGNFSGDCTPLTNSPSFSFTRQSTFGTFAGTRYSYVASADFNTVFQCPIDAMTGGFSGACSALISSFEFPIGITLTPSTS